MILNEDQKNTLMICGRFNFPASKCMVMLDIEEKDIYHFAELFQNPLSELRKTYEMGKIKSEFEIMEALENKVHDGEDGADEAAKALYSMRRNQTYNELLSEYFGI